MRRCAGLLLHPTSLPSRFGVGDLGPAATRFLDWAQAAGQTRWQVLPLGPTFDHGSPYDSPSAFAGNPLLISPELLVRDGLLRASDLHAAPKQRDQADFPALHQHRAALLRRAFERFASSRHAMLTRLQAEADDFANAPEQAHWLADWCLFAALADDLGHRAWWRWPSPLARRHRRALERARERLAYERAFHRFVQFCFARQWHDLQAAARARGIEIIGDVPIYVAHQSADVWANRRLFALHADGTPTAVSGVPPDDFADDGQLWGNPLYRWSRMRTKGFDWWVRRVAHQAARCDHLRLDHFRGFVAYWRVPGDAETAREGEWRPGPSRALFDAIERGVERKARGASLIAEDLGVITDDVIRLRKALGYPGTRVLHFGFGDSASEHAPHNLDTDIVVYTGTHDNDTTQGWFAKLREDRQANVLRYLGGRPSTVHRDLIRAAYTSVASAAIVPVQDVLGLSGEARMNLPGTATGNWGWRLEPGRLRAPAAQWLRGLVEATGRGADSLKA